MDQTVELKRLMQDISVGISGMKHTLAEHDKALQKLGGQPRKGSLPVPGMPGKNIKAEEDEEGGHRLLGEILQKVYLAGKDHDAADWLKGHGIFWQREMQEDDQAEGGYLVPVEHLPEVLYIPERGVIEPRCRVVQMGSKTKNIPRMDTSVTTCWVAEEVPITPSQPVLGMETLTAKKQAGLVTVSNELLEDSSPEVQTFLEQIFAEAMGLEFDSQLLSGTGAPCSGLLTAKAGYSVVMGSGSTSFSAITFDILSLAISKIAPTVLAGAVFALHPDVLHYVRVLKDNNGQPIWSPAGAGPGQIYNYDIVETTKAPGAGDSAPATPFAVFGNFRGFIKGDRRQLTVAVDPYGKFDTNQTRIRWTRRLALHVAQPKMFCRILTHS
jgi:HK97 family phage major capsid protein